MTHKQEEACWAALGLILFCALVSLPFLRLLGVL